MNTNHLDLNPAKTKFMLITRSSALFKNCPSFYLNGQLIERVHYFKYLGIWFSDDLSWSKYVESVCCRARRLLGYMYRTFSPYCSQATIIHLYKSQVIPIIEYGCVVWDPHLQKDQILLENVQRFAVKLATEIPRHLSLLIYIFFLSLIVEPIFKLVCTYKFLYGYLYCSPGFLNLHPNPNLCVFHSTHLIQPLVKTVSQYHSFFLRKYCKALELLT